ATPGIFFVALRAMMCWARSNPGRTRACQSPYRTLPRAPVARCGPPQSRTTESEEEGHVAADRDHPCTEQDAKCPEDDQSDARLRTHASPHHYCAQAQSNGDHSEQEGPRVCVLLNEEHAISADCAHHAQEPDNDSGNQRARS